MGAWWGRGGRGAECSAGRAAWGGWPRSPGSLSVADRMPHPGHVPARLAGGNCGAAVTADGDMGTFGCLSLTVQRGGASSRGAIAKGTALPVCCLQPKDTGAGRGSDWGRRSGSPCPDWAVPQLLSPVPQDKGLRAGGGGRQESTQSGGGLTVMPRCSIQQHVR